MTPRWSSCRSFLEETPEILRPIPAHGQSTTIGELGDLSRALAPKRGHVIEPGE